MKQGKIQNQKFVARHKDMPFENLLLDIEDHEQMTPFQFVKQNNPSKNSRQRGR